MVVGEGLSISKHLGYGCISYVYFYIIRLAYGLDIGVMEPRSIIINGFSTSEI